MNTKNQHGNPNGRQHERTKMRARIKLMRPSGGNMVVYCADLSDGGIFVLQGDDVLPDVGAVVQLQVQDLPVAAPILTAIVVRKTSDGIGLMFIDDANN